MALLFEDLTRWLCSAPAKLVGLDRKVLIKTGYDADLVIWNPARSSSGSRRGRFIIATTDALSGPGSGWSG